MAKAEGVHQRCGVKPTDITDTSQPEAATSRYQPPFCPLAVLQPTTMSVQTGVTRTPLSPVAVNAGVASPIAVDTKPAATVTPVLESKATATVDTPTILAAFQKVLSGTPHKRVVRVRDGGAANVLGTPPPHSGLPSAVKAHPARENRCPTGNGKASSNKKSQRVRVTPGVKSAVRSRPRAAKRRALFSTADIGNKAAATTPAAPVAAADPEGTPMPVTPEAGDATPESCHSTPTKDADVDAAAPATASQRDGSSDADGASLPVPGRFLTPSFFQGGSDRRPKAQRALGSRLAAAAGATTPPRRAVDSGAGAGAPMNNTPRSFMRALSRKNKAANKTVEANASADTNVTPRSMVKRFITSGLRSGDLTADTPATLRRRSLARDALAKEAAAQKAAEEAAAAEAARGTSVAQRLLHLVLFVVLFLIVVLSMCNISRPVRKAVQTFVFGQPSHARYT